MTLTTEAHDAYVSARFDALQGRFKDRVEADDFRLRALLRVLRPAEGLCILDLGCGKGRFAAWLREQGANVIGLDRSRAMIQSDHSDCRVQGTAHALPFSTAAFDAVYAVEVFQHLADHDAVLGEIHRVLKIGGSLVVIDKNHLALDVHRPWIPSAWMKRLDVCRGRWMYPSNAPVQERWLNPEGFSRKLRRNFDSVGVTHLLTPRESRSRLFRRIPGIRLFTLWQARRPGIPDA